MTAEDIAYERDNYTPARCDACGRLTLRWTTYDYHPDDEPLVFDVDGRGCRRHSRA